MTKASLVASKRIYASLTRKHFSSNAGSRITRPMTTTNKIPPSARITPIGSPNFEPIEITPEITRNNILLALFLLTFCGSVTAYSIYAVGRSGAVDGEDPIVSLQKEAELAMKKKAAEIREMEETQDMLQKVQSGAYDPDNYDEELEEEEKELRDLKQQKKPWWKIW